MSESEYGANANDSSLSGATGGQQRAVVSPGRTLGARSASPAKRSAADMEGADQKETRVPGSFNTEDSNEPTDYDMIYEGMTAAASPSSPLASQTQVRDADINTDGGIAADDTITNKSNSMATTMSGASHKEPYSTEEIDKQVQHVLQLTNQILDEGDRGVVISTTWLSRVMSRASENLKNNDYPKDAREGLVGPLDNSDIVPKDAIRPPYLSDPQKQDFVPLLPGLTMEDQYQVVPFEAYGYIVGTYGIGRPAKPIVRYAHNTAPTNASRTNVQYEVYPPLITVRRVSQPASDSDQPIKSKPATALNALKLKKEADGRGQAVDDAPKLVSSSTESFSKFLVRAKEAVNIAATRKVKVWRLMSPQEIVVDQPGTQQSGVPSPPASRDTSPSKSSSLKLVVDKETFDKLEVGKDLEYIDLPDNSSDPKYKGIGKLSMDDAGLKTGMTTIILEEQIGGPAGGEFQSDSKKMINRVIPKKSGSKTGSGQTSGRTSPAPGMMTRGRTRKDGRTRGTVGLMNLGNTCYMNSALQCIRSVEELAAYFLSSKYKKEINNDNPLGHHGAMANAYASVLRGIYDSSSGGAFTPTSFKKTLGSIQPMFSGYGQQDSQEFLSFLVDALHEDLNRIIKKPYIENPDSDDSKVHDPDYILELGTIYRDNHRKRNDSVAMDLFSGFYKNTMECPVCDKVSVTFDPYSLLTVQLPMEHAFQHTITFIPLNDRPVLHEIDMDKNSTIKTLKEHIAKKHAGVEAGRLWVVEVYSHKIYKTFDDATTLAEANIGANEYIFMFELDASPKNTPSTKKSYGFYSSSKKEDDVPAEGMESEKADVFAVPIFHRRKKGSTMSSMDTILHPLYITLNRDEAQNYEIILKKVLVAVSNITTRPILTEFNEDRASGTVEEVDSQGEPDRAPVNSDDSAGVSDHSAQSEDGYVNVSLESHNPPEQANGASPMQLDDIDRRVPAGFMEPQYLVSPALRNHLFDLKYAESSDNNMHCASLSGFKDMSVRPMVDRVKKPSRRSSVDSAASDESTASNSSEPQANGESEESDADEPDIRLGDTPLSEETVEESDDELAQGHSEIMEPSQIDPSAGRSRKNRRKTKRNGRGKRSGIANGPTRNPKRLGLSLSLNKNKRSEGGPYYVQLGECIVLDWKPEGFDSLFEGDARDVEEMRGTRITNDNGRQGPMFLDEELQARKAKRAERKQNGIDLEDCFVETGKREVLSEDNAWYCNRCKELRQAHKTLEIWTLPDILVVHMKRFGGTRSFRDKIDVFVDYPIDGLDMTNKVGVKEDGKEYVYDLFAVDNHYGGLGGGHYTAFAKNFYDGEWYDYNDSITSKVGNGRNLKSAAAYLLFYRRRSEQPLGPSALQELVTEFRKPASESADEIDDESGEGKLGGPTLSSLHRNGSSSVLAGPGVAMKSSPRGHAAGNGGVGVGSPLTQRQMMRNDDEDDGGEPGSAALHGWQDEDSAWSFDNLNDASGHLLPRVDHGEQDNDSTKAEYDDHDSGLGGSSVNGMDTSGMNTPSGVNNSPELRPILSADYGDDEDSHFSDAVGGGYIHSIEEPATHEIVLGDAPDYGEDEHDKMD